MKCVVCGVDVAREYGLEGCKPPKHSVVYCSMKCFGRRNEE